MELVCLAVWTQYHDDAEFWVSNNRSVEEEEGMCRDDIMEEFTRYEDSSPEGRAAERSYWVCSGCEPLRDDDVELETRSDHYGDLCCEQCGIEWDHEKFCYVS